MFTVKTLNYNDEDVFWYVFGDLAVGSRPSQHYVNDLCARIRVMSIDELDKYRDHPSHVSVSSRTRKRKFFVDNSDEQRVLFEILSENRNVVMKALARKFDEAFYDAHHLDIPSVSTVYKAVIRRKWTRKVVTGVHIRNDTELQMSIWTTLLSHVRAEDLVDVDGMAISKDDFYNRFGFAPMGERCEQMQFEIPK